ncbi:hypothetical protein PINS_up000259 [Pythium insidiosum]|nr:hypothetical protein PINS_up000259 [Pythium insidiosum]
MAMWLQDSRRWCQTEDFSYVDTRSRQMSKKAMEAKANEAAYKQWKRGGATTTPTPAARRTDRSQDNHVIEIMSDEENETKNEHAKDEGRRRQPTAQDHRQAEQRALRDAMAHAAMARFHVSARAEDVQSVVRQVAPRPEAEDDEDSEPTTTVYCDTCNKARILSLPEAAQARVETTDRWTCSLLAGVDGKDASCAALDDEVEQIAGRKLALLLEKVQIATRRDLANASLPVTLKQLAHPLDATYNAMKAKLTAVIDEARLDEVNDAMLEILGGDDALLGTLELQKLGTPADLVETPTDLIVQGLCGHEITLQQVQQWQRDAKTRLERAPWMGEWRTI